MARKDFDLDKLSEELYQKSLDHSYRLDPELKHYYTKIDHIGHKSLITRILGNDHQLASFLIQVRFYWVSRNSNPFYKHQFPSPNCKPNDSWAEELGLSKHHIERIAKIFNPSRKKARNRTKARELAETGQTFDTLVVPCKMSHGAIWWFFNERLYDILLKMAIDKYENLGMAIPRNSGNGQYLISRDCILTEKQQNIRETQDYFEREEKIDEKEKAKREADRKKNMGTRKTNVSPMIIKNQKHGARMSVDFFLKESIILEAMETYNLTREQVKDEERKFKNYYTNIKPSYKAIDWDRHFIDQWLVNKKDYDNSPRKDANTERRERIAELAEQSATERAGTTDVYELARRLREKRRGNGSTSS